MYVYLIEVRACGGLATAKNNDLCLSALLGREGTSGQTRINR